MVAVGHIHSSSDLRRGGQFPAIRISLALPERRALNVDLDPMVTERQNQKGQPTAHSLFLEVVRIETPTLSGLHNKREARGEGVASLLCLGHC